MFQFSLLSQPATFDEERGIITFNNRQLNKGSNQLTQRKARLYFKLSEECNLKCVYCFQAHSNPVTSIHLEEYTLLIKKLLEANNFDIIFFGGEPLLDSNLDNIAALFNVSNSKISFYTNGCFSIDSLNFLIDHRCSLGNIIISVDGPETIHNKRRILTGGNAYSVIMSNIQHLVHNGILPVIQINMDRENAEYIVDYIREILTVNEYESLGIILNRVLHSKKTLDELEFLKYCKTIVEKYPFLNIRVNSVVIKNIRSKIIRDNYFDFNRCDIGRSLVFDFQTRLIYSCPQYTGTTCGSFSENNYSLDQNIMQKYINYASKYDKICLQCKVRDYCKYGCFIEQDLKESNCMWKTRSEIQFVLDNYLIFLSDTLHITAGEFC